MLTKKVKSRIFLLAIALVILFIIFFFIFRSLEDSLVYFFSPTEVNNKPDISLTETIRVGGLVKTNSIKKKNETIVFIITDLKNEIIVSYTGLAPNLFAEGKGVIAEGKLKDKSYFIADKILAKHDENYMPPELEDVLKKNE